MKKLHLISLMLLVCLGFTVYGQEPDTVKYGNLVINSDPLEVQVEISSLGIKNLKTDSALIIEFIRPAKYLVRVSAKKKVLEYEINVKPEIETHLFFNLKQKEVIATEYTFKNMSKSTMEFDDDNDTTVFVIVEEQPSFPGGEEAKREFFLKNLHYPVSALKNNIQGRVYVTFKIEKDGSVSDVKVFKGIGGGCDEEAVRLIRMMPKWTPGKQRSKPVRIQVVMPVKFMP